MENKEFTPPVSESDENPPFLWENGRFPAPPTPDPIEPDPPNRNWRGCWITFIALIVVLSLLATSLASLYWIGEELAASWTASQITPTPSLKEAGRIAYIGSEGQVFTVQANGDDKRQLTDAPTRYQFPAWATDSNQLAVLGGSGIMLLTDEAEPTSTQLYESHMQAPFYLYWSPDNSQISFLANSQNGIALRVIAADGTSDAEIRGYGTPFYWDWLNDSRQILAHTGASGVDAQLGLLQADGEVEEIAPPGAFQSPGISENGRYWAYAEDMGDGNSWLVVTDTENGEQWTERHPAVAALSWSPATDQLAFTTGIQDPTSFWGPLRLFDTATNEVSLLSNNVVIAFFWSPNGRYIATINTGDIEQDFGVNVADKPTPNRAMQAKTNGQFNPHQFNLAVIDVETGEETQVMSFFPTVTFITQFLPFFDQYALSHNIWSPNNDAIVLPVREEGENRVKVVRVDGSELVDLGQGDMAFWSR